MLEQHGFSPFPANLPHHQGDHGLLDAGANHDLQILDAGDNHDLQVLDAIAGDNHSLLDAGANHSDDIAANFSCKAW